MRKFFFPTYQMVSAGRRRERSRDQRRKKSKREMSAPFVFSFPRKSYSQLSLESSFDPFSRFVNTHSIFFLFAYFSVLLVSKYKIFTKNLAGNVVVSKYLPRVNTSHQMDTQTHHFICIFCTFLLQLVYFFYLLLSINYSRSKIYLIFIIF